MDVTIDQIESYESMTHRHWVALGNKVGGMGNIKAILRDELSLELKEVFRKLFDKNGRFIPFPGLKSAFCDLGSQYSFHQPEIDYGVILRRIRHYLSVGLQVKAEKLVLPTAEEFEERVAGPKGIRAKLEADPRTATALKGIWLPIALPQLVVPSRKKGGYGVLLEQFVSGAADAYQEAYPGRTFTNYRQGTLAGKVEIIPGTRHERLIEAMAKGPVVGIVLLPFGGYSINACRETFGGHELSGQIPDYMLLGGGLDTAVAYMAYAKELCRDNNTPIVRCPALKWQSDSLYFYAYDSNASFAGTGNLTDADGSYSAPVFCLG